MNPEIIVEGCLFFFPLLLWFAEKFFGDSSPLVILGYYINHGKWNVMVQSLWFTLLSFLLSLP